jgi:hypothetical protein
VGLVCGTGCANSARFVEVNNSGGVVAIPSNSNGWPTYYRKHAEELMQAKCPAGYVVYREEEVVTGVTQSVNTTTDTSGNPKLAAWHLDTVTENTRQTTTSTNQTEYRLWFRRSDAPASPSVTPASYSTPPAPAAPPAGYTQSPLPAAPAFSMQGGGLPGQPIPVGR